ncbi:MAG: ATP-dependent DNA helicase RecQ, ATP-dependent DNA helicase RecQ [Candidatus Peregrinibacteria bacterium GW2011_GWF2_33_10]|nr:MAG: ATP-dependent DNA helicase RecQ, ATP-dependent DNA helicase RecQ [Candidatus Peregrinibacteria bacterium GW2011_GWF2_33_10]OGJ45071.1 MAG: ATP-dependent DNA helicase RecQ [Candidatus Peregrinibacteria bacterium RIFOXYA2_FULL_33_21]OGJ46064.1 MAG: ATP-dependent DNA helicase RecQ [Candidatus Peregrinibacteria bacterium RIFOXYA12_FULL_33_12]OGJ50845.1 MAG: ATP-dependent DNA helicase RecQ [Candidatus Peregrinibacteria bacterium RIFOXYB2_FULL_33_20]
MYDNFQAKILLKQYFGYEEFKPLQAEIIANVLAGKDSLVLMPTGGGKSMCYQLPALSFPGLTLVISPLISLMKDQVDGLNTIGIKAAFINSTLNDQEIAQIKAEAVSQNLKILYIAPERLVTQNFQDFLSKLQINLIAIDEAHCISEYGHDFRPDYQNLTILRKVFPTVPIIALTATATTKVQKDIIDQLNIHEAKVFLSSFDRQNLSYIVYPKKNAFSSLLQLLEKYRDQSVIIYCLSRKDTENLALNLQNNGFKALAYHAGLDSQRRHEIQDKFIKDEVDIITATIAFGMGIDKPDVRLVVHYDLPKNLEGYYQETGRAGRDSLPSECVLFYSYGDKIKQDFFIKQIENQEEKQRAFHKLEQMISFCKLNSCRRQYLLRYFGEDYFKENCQACDVCLNPVEEFDGTEITKKILSAIIRVGQNFGSAYIIRLLLGSNDQRILDNKHDGLSVFGIVADFDRSELRNLVEALLQKGLIQKSEGQYPTLKVSVKGLDFLKKSEPLFLPKPRKSELIKKEKKAFQYDEILFQKLRILRKELADERGVPPFIIFNDSSLQQMACSCPKTLADFAKIHGVGQEKLKYFGSVFVELIKNYCSEADIGFVRNQHTIRNIKRVGSTYDETLQLFLQKFSLKQIAEKRQVKIGTIIDHIEKLLTINDSLDIEYLKPAPEVFDKIAQAFQNVDGVALRPVFDYLRGEYSYDEIKLIRLFIVTNQRKIQ